MALLARRLVRNDLVQHGSLVFASTMVSSGFLYVFYFIASRNLGVERYGTLSALLSASLLLSVFATVGTTIIVRFAAEFDAVGDAGKLRRLCDIVILWCGGTTLIFAIAGYAFREPVSRFLHVEDATLIELTALMAALNIVLPVMRGVLQGAQRFTAFAASTLVETFGKTMIGVALMVAGLGIAGAITGIVVGFAIAAGYTYIQLRRSFPAPPDRMRIDIRRLVATTGGIACSIFGVTTLMFFDVILAKHYLTAKEAGLYGAAALAGRALYMVISFLPTVLLPKATARAASGQSVRRLLFQAAMTAMGFSLAVLALYGLFPNFVIRVFAGAAYASAAPLVFPLAGAAALLGMANLLISYKVGLHRFDFIVPLLVIMTGEIAAIAYVHNRAEDIVRVLLIGHALVLAASLYRITAPAHGASRVAGSRAASEGAI
jgi:O-antigen/teichoic acid export membrane protein